MANSDDGGQRAPSAGKGHFGWVGVLIVALAALAVMGWANRYGADVVPDSGEYISGGLRLAHGQGFSIPNRSGPAVPLTWFPPLFPTLIACFERLSLPIYKSIGWFNACSYTLVVAASGLWVWHATRSRFWATLCSLAVLTNHPLYYVESFALSEPLFLLWLLVFLWCFVRWRRQSQLRFIVLAGLCIGFGMLTRYAGLCLLPAGEAMIFFAPGVRWMRKAIAIGLLGMIGLAPPRIWAHLHTPPGQSSTGREIRWHPITGEQLKQGIDVMAAFILPAQYDLGVPSWVLLPAFLAGVGLLWRASRARGPIEPEPPEQTSFRQALLYVCLWFIVIYLLFLIASISFVDGALDERFMSIIALPVMVVFCIAGESIGRSLRATYLLWGLGMAMAGFFLAHGADVYGDLSQRDGPEALTWFPTLQSDTLDSLRDIPPETDVWSDRPYAIYMAYRLRTDEMPYRPDGAVSDEQATAQGVQTLRDEMTEQGGGWIVFWHQLDDFSDGLLSEDDIRQNFVIAEEDKYEDGVLLRIDDPQATPVASTEPATTEEAN